MERPDLDDDELAALALAADPDAPIDPDAVPFGPGGSGAELLPAWYMPPALAAPSLASGATRRRRRWVVGLVVGALVVVNGFGLCVTYGVPEIAW